MTFIYKRTDHFRCWINQLIGADNTYNVPSDVSEKVTDFLIQHNQPVTVTSVKIALSKLKLRTYYEYIGHIVMAITHERSQAGFLDLDEKTVLDLNTMFEKVAVAHIRIFSNSNKKSFFSYPYVVFRLLERLDHPERFKLQLLRSKEKKESLDKMWFTICDDLGWDDLERTPELL